MNDRWLKLTISLGALGMILLHLLRPELRIDAVTFGLIVIAILPWLNKLIKKAEFPGGWKVEFQEVQAAGEKVTKGNTAETRLVEAPPSYAEISDKDPNLALVGLRIEIERRIRRLAMNHGITETKPLTRLVEDLRKQGVLDDSSVAGLRELVMAGNQAAHGAEVAPNAATWAVDYGPQVLAALDAKLNT